VPLEIRLKPVETLLFRSDVVAVGKFRCAATHPLFRDSGPCSHHTFVFPRTMTGISHANGPSFVGTPGAVVFYNQHQEYSRRAISEVDASDWYTVADDVLFDIVDADSEERPFRAASARVDARTFLEQRMLFDALDRGTQLDPASVEETVLRILGRVWPRAPERARSRDADAVERVRELIARDPSRSAPLRALARAVGLSPFQLCRAFRAHTGETMTEYRHSLRLRLALDRLRDRRLDLTTLAFDLGYASHSHFTSVFRRQFGITPSVFRVDCGGSASAFERSNRKAEALPPHSRAIA
jgi:AraC-like DNA-binding protein